MKKVLSLPQSRRRSINHSNKLMMRRQKQSWQPCRNEVGVKHTLIGTWLEFIVSRHRLGMKKTSSDSCEHVVYFKLDTTEWMKVKNVEMHKPNDK